MVVKQVLEESLLRKETEYKIKVNSMRNETVI